MAFDLSAPAVDFNFFLARKYATLQQQADAETQNAGSTRIQAVANANVAGTVADQNRVQTKLMPAESASRIRLQDAQTGLTREQAAVVAPMSRAQIGQLGAETRLTGLQGDVITRTALTPYSAIVGGGGAGQLGGSLRSVMGPAGYSGFQLGGSFADDDPRARRLPGESAVAYMDRTGRGA